MAKARLQARLEDPWLLGVDFPRMEIEDGGTLVERVDTADRPAAEFIRCQAEVPAATGRQVAPEQAGRGDRDLEQAGARLVGEAWCVGHAVVVVLHRVDAGAVAVAGFEQHVEGPEVAHADREARRAVAQHGLAAQVFEQRLGALHVVGKDLARLLAGALVAIAVAREFVAAGDDVAHQLRVALGDPAQREEGGVCAALGKQGEQALHVALDAAGLRVPGATVEMRRQGRDLEVVFDVNGQCVGEPDGRGLEVHERPRTHGRAPRRPRPACPTG